MCFLSEKNKNYYKKLISLYSVEKDNKKAILGVVYKDVKPRVDTRWKKAEAAVTQKPKTTVIVPAAISRPLSRQNSIKSNDVKKEKSVKTITETITMQIKKTTTLTTGIDLKKIQKPNEVQFIRSPQSIKKKEKQDGGFKFFESHSTHLLQQVDILKNYLNNICL